MAIEYAEKVRRIPVYPAADGYASDASSAVRLTKALLGLTEMMTVR